MSAPPREVTLVARVSTLYDLRRPRAKQTTRAEAMASAHNEPVTHGGWLDYEHVNPWEREADE